MSENTQVLEKGYELKTITIFSNNGKLFDIYPQMIEVNMFEDIYNSTMSGSVVISDSIDLFASTPFNGFEYIKIIMNKKGYSKDIILDKTFRIYKMQMGDVSKTTTSNQVYTLYFCSEENILSLSRVISKSYRGQTTSNIIRDILFNQLNVLQDRVPSENIEESFGRNNVIIPYLNPLTAINWISSRTLDSNGMPSFMFFENRNGFNFQSLDKIFKQETKVKYTYDAKNIEKENENSGEEYHDVISYQFMNVYDIMRATTNGMFSGVLKAIDLLKQRADDTVFDYEEEFNKSTHVENMMITKMEQRKIPYSFENNNEDRLKNKTTKNYFAFRRMYPTNLTQSRSSYITQKQPGLVPNLVESWMLQRVSKINQLNYFKLKLVVPGDTLVTIGDIIEFRIPLVAKKVKGEKNENPYYSGRYLVTAIRHMIDYQKYEMIIEATRDCVVEEYPKADNTNPTLSEIKKQ